MHIYSFLKGVLKAVILIYEIKWCFVVILLCVS